MRNIVLTGFMGTGKTTLGRALAVRLGRRFVDMDEELARRAGKPIPRIFAEDGEFRFRQMEVLLCQELSEEGDLVIATGGGTLIDPDNRLRMLRNGAVICLRATPEEIIQRTSDDVSRPLLEGSDRYSQAVRLLEVRAAIYDSFPWQVSTSGQALPDLLNQVEKLARVVQIPVRYQEVQYPVYIGHSILGQAGSLLKCHGLADGASVAVVSNPVVAPLYAQQVQSALSVAGYIPALCLIPDGETYKTLDTVRQLYESFLDMGLDRSGTVLALGGGVTGDIAGFATATYMRGLPLIQVPTTLLAMTDSSVGGKTGVDLLQGKNLVGAFKQPTLVLIDLDVLATLPAREFRSGMAEVIKHGLIGDIDLVQDLQELGGEADRLAPEYLGRSIRVKARIVEADPHEHGVRATLNLGHTTAHALETLSGFSLRHGEAVSIGVVAAALLAEKLGDAEPGLAEMVTQMFAEWDLPVRCPAYPVRNIIQAMAYDKKKRGDHLRWVIPRAAGDVVLREDVPIHLVEQTLVQLGALDA